MTASTIRADCFLLAGLFVVAILAGWVLNRCQERPLPLIYQDKSERMKTFLPRGSAPRAGEARLPVRFNLEEFSAHVRAGRGLVLDVRPEIFHRLGHVPGALSLPREDFENGFAALRSRLEADKGQPLVIYCSGGSCEDSWLVAQRLAEMGFLRLAVFEGGWTEWIEAGRARETGP